MKKFILTIALGLIVVFTANSQLKTYQSKSRVETFYPNDPKKKIQKTIKQETNTFYLDLTTLLDIGNEGVLYVPVNETVKTIKFKVLDYKNEDGLTYVLCIAHDPYWGFTELDIIIEQEEPIGFGIALSRTYPTGVEVYLYNIVW